MNEEKLWQWSMKATVDKLDAIWRTLFMTKPWVTLSNIDVSKDLEKDWNNPDRSLALRAQRGCASIKSRWVKKLHAEGYLIKMR